MARTRISTTVDDGLLRVVREETGLKDSELLDLALAALARDRRSAEIDERILTGYAEQPLNTPDEWGDLASFSEAVREANRAASAKG
jgi:hypothetical protein